MTKVVIGIAGGTASGKSEFARLCLAHLGDAAAVLAHDAYYRDLGGLDAAARAATNFDAPEALETERLVADIAKLRAGEDVMMPAYDFAAHTRVPDGGIRVEARPVVIVDGILVLAEPSLREAMDLAVFVDTPADVRLARRIRRDVRERGRTVESVLAQYEATVRPMHDLHVEPSKGHAELIVPGDGEMARAVEVVVAHAWRAVGGRRGGGAEGRGGVGGPGGVEAEQA